MPLNRHPRLCATCGKNLHSKQSYDKHVERCKLNDGTAAAADEKAEDPRYCCEVCGKEYSGRHAQAMYVQHKKRVHSRAEECPVCGKRFGYRRIMLAHMMVHQGGDSIAKIRAPFHARVHAPPRIQTGGGTRVHALMQLK